MNGLELGSCLLLYCIDGDINGGDLKHSSLSTVPRLCGRSSFNGDGDGTENSLTNVAVVLAVDAAEACPSALTPGAGLSSARVGDGERMAANSCDLAGDEAVCDGLAMSRWSLVKLALVGLRRLGIFTAGVSRRRNGFASTGVDVDSGGDDCGGNGGSLMTSGGPFGPGSFSLSVVLN